MTRTLRTHIVNTGTVPLRLIAKNGSEVVLAPGQSEWFEFKRPTAFRVACNECSLTDGGHETWCSRWQPYVADS